MYDKSIGVSNASRMDFQRPHPYLNSACCRTVIFRRFHTKSLYEKASSPSSASSSTTSDEAERATHHSSALGDSVALVNFVFGDIRHVHLLEVELAGSDIIRIVDERN